MLNVNNAFQQEILETYLSNIELPESLDNVLHEAVRELSQISEGELSLEEVVKRLSVLSQVNWYIQNLETATVCGNELRITQKQAIIWLQNWLLRNLDNPELMWHVVQPPSLWKTNIAVLFSQFFQGKTLYISHNSVGTTQALTAFEKHYGEQKKVEEIQKKQLEADIYIGLFDWFKKLLNSWEFKTEDIGVIFFDEWDVNALSKKRSKFLQHISQKYSIPMIALSATELQSSGKQLQDVFPWNIMNLPLPESLPYCLKHKLVPNMQFLDVYLDADLYTNEEELKRWLNDDHVSEFIWDSKWLEYIISFHIEHYPDQNFILAFRDNTLNEKFINIAKTKGLEVVSLDGKLSTEEKTQVIERYKRWEISIVGSKLVGRGLDIPECWVFYNSMLTYSPQLFWQGLGRNMRLDETNEDKKSISVTFLPKKITDEENRSFWRWLYPLSSAAFFYKNYYSSENEIVPTSYELSQVQSDSIRDIHSVMHLQNMSKKYWWKFTWKLDFISKAFQIQKPSGYKGINYVLSLQNHKLLDLIENYSWWEEYFDPSEDYYISEEDAYYIDYYRSLTEKRGSLDRETEKKLTYRFNETWDRKYIDIFLEYGTEVLCEMAKSIYFHYYNEFRDSQISITDLIHQWVEGFYKWAETYDMSRAVKSRIIIHMLRYASSSMTNFIREHCYDHIRYPGYVGERDYNLKTVNHLDVSLTGKKYSESDKQKLQVTQKVEKQLKIIESLKEKWKELEAELLSINEAVFLEFFADRTFDEKEDVSILIQVQLNEIRYKKKKTQYEKWQAQKWKFQYKLEIYNDQIEKYNYQIESLVQAQWNIIQAKKSVEENQTKIKNEYRKYISILSKFDDIYALYEWYEVEDASEVLLDTSFEIHWEVLCMQNKVRKMITGLTGREKKVLSMKHGIGMNSEFSLEEISKQFGNNIERIRQIEAKALRKLRHPSRSEHLKVYVDWADEE